MPRHDDEDGNTIIDDGLSDYGDNEDRPSPVTSAQAAAIRKAESQRRKLHTLLLCLSLFISLVVSTAKYYARGGPLSRGEDGSYWDWGNGMLDRENQRRLNLTLEYLAAANVSGSDDWIPKEESATGSLGALFVFSDSPQYMAALWMATIDSRRLDIPDVSTARASSLDNYLFLQRYVLAVLFFATGGLDQWTYTLRFLSRSHECYWSDLFTSDDLPPGMGYAFGVRCDSHPDIEGGDELQKERIVTQINMFPANNMVGTLPMELHHLQYLKELYISVNPGIVGTIPPEYGSLTRLKMLALSYNSIEGKIPQTFSALKNLEQLNLETNYLVCNTNEGDLDFVKGMVYLINLSLEYNSNITGTLPAFLSDLSQLEIISLSNNNMTGTIPSSWSSLKNLRYLLLDDNSLSGSVDVVQNLTNLTNVYLQGNSFNDTIDETFFSELTKLEQLDISNNTFRGKVPGHFFSFPDLEVLDMSRNQLSGELPGDSMAVTKSNLQHLSLHSNNITGAIPTSIAKLINLTHLDLSSNELSGDIVSEMGDMTNLTYLFLGRNNFTGRQLPDWLQKLTKLDELSLKGLSMMGQIPDWVGTTLTELKFLDLGENALTGTMPESLGSLVDLWVLILNKNQLNGTIPQSMARLSYLEVLVIDDNNLTGDANAMCSRADKINFFVADCGTNTGLFEPDAVEINCGCCSLCCHDENVTCNDAEWIGNHESMWENGYNRWQWKFESGSVGPLTDYRYTKT